MRQAHLDGLRGLAALLVVVDHGLIGFDTALLSGQKIDSINNWDVWLSGAPFFLLMGGSFAVCLFFVLSGYVLAEAYSRSRLGLLALIVKRYVRLALPVAVVCLIAYALLDAGLMHNQQLAVVTRSSWLKFQYGQTASIWKALSEGFYYAFTPHGAAHLSYDVVLWTMPLEMMGSIMLMIVFRLVALIPRSWEQRRVLLIAALGMLTMIGVDSVLGIFAIGALLSVVGTDRLGGPKIAIVLLIVGLFLGSFPVGGAPWPVFIWLYMHSPTLPHWLAFPLDVGTFWRAVGAVLVLVAVNNWPACRRLLASPPCRFLGEISFPLYLIHFPLLMSLNSILALALNDAGMPYRWTVVLSELSLVIMSLAAATLFWWLWERRAIRLADQLGRAIDRPMERLRRKIGLHPLDAVPR